MGIRLLPLELRPGDREELERRVRSNTVEARASERARLVLMAADGASNRDIGAVIGMHYNQVAVWRSRYGEFGLVGLGDGERPGRPPIYDHDDVLLLVKTVTEQPPDAATRWTMDAIARRLCLARRGPRLGAAFELVGPVLGSQRSLLRSRVKFVGVAVEGTRLRRPKALRRRIERTTGRDGALCAEVVQRYPERCVFAMPDGGSWHPHAIGRAFGRLVASSGLPGIRFHDLRHTHESHLLAAGVNVKVVSERLGHASVAFTLDVYSHVMPGQQADAAAAVAELVDSL